MNAPARQFEAKPAARGNRLQLACAHCGAAFSRKASDTDAKFCSTKCKYDSKRIRPPNTPRPCAECGAMFTPSRKRGAAQWCSKSCVWKATKGPEFNARIARETIEQRAAAQRGTGTRGYVKRGGRHEHRVVAEQTLGRALLAHEVVHHIDGNKHNNDPNNLAVMTQGEHMQEHGLGLPGITPAHEPWKYTRHYRGGR